MKRWLLVFLLLIGGLSLTAAAAEPDADALFREQAEASGGAALFDSLPEETRGTLRRLGVNGLDAEGLQGMKPDALWDTVWVTALDQLARVLPVAGVVLGVLVICAFLEGTRHAADGGGAGEAFGVVASLAGGTAVLLPLIGCMRQVMAAADSVSVFMKSFVPVYGGVLVATGRAATAASYQSVMLFAAELVAMLLTGVVAPLLTMSLAMGLTGTLAGGEGTRLDALGSSLSKTATWLLTGSVTLFVGLLTLQGIVGASADSLAARTAKLSVSSAVPVVGGPLSEALGTVQGCLQLLKSTLGMFGVAATVGILLPPLLNCVAWSITLSFCGAAADMLGVSAMAGLFKAAQGVMKTLIGVLAACGLLMIVGTTVITMATRG